MEEGVLDTEMSPSRTFPAKVITDDRLCSAFAKKYLKRRPK
jgi:hypothetical protein